MAITLEKNDKLYPTVDSLKLSISPTPGLPFTPPLPNQPRPLQGPRPPNSQSDLITYCQQPAVDIIPIGFPNIFPRNVNGYPGSNFGNKCGGAVYPDPGPDRKSVV